MIKHNKKKNTSIVYEQLMTLAARLIAEKNIKEYNFVMSFIKEHFSPSKELGKERKILSGLLEASCEEEYVGDLIKESVQQMKSLSYQNLEKQKNILIDKINKEIGPSLFNIPIKNYKLYASVQVLMNEELNGYSTSTPQERVKIRKILKENITKEKEKVFETKEEIDNFTYKVLINKYNKKYNDSLNEDQKELVSSWVKFIINEEEKEIRETLNKKMVIVEQKIKDGLKNKEHKVSDYYELLKEAQETLKQKDFTVINEDNMYEILRYLDLVEELGETQNA